MLGWQQLVRLSDPELARCDLAAVNLACAAGLPGAQQIDVPGCLRQLDSWAGSVGEFTERRLPTFRARPHEYNYSEAYFRVLGLITVLQRDLGVHFNPAKAGLPPEAPYDLEDQFIHGVLQGPGGTCATLPVVYAAVGRRLGYPIKLAATRRHLFARWEDQATGERFNIEASNQGLTCPPDDDYRQWPARVSAEEERACGWLKTLTPRQELADAMANRGFCLHDHRRYREAVDAFVWGSILHPESARYPYCVTDGIRTWEQHLRGLYPPRFPRVEILTCRDRRRFPTIPWEVERAIRMLESVEDCLFEPRHEAWWWRPLREGLPPQREVPDSITVDLTREQTHDDESNAWPLA